MFERGIAYPLYELVTRERARQGMTAEELQRRSGVHRATVVSWKKTKRPPHAASVIRVATVLGIDIDTALRASRGERVSVTASPGPTFEDPIERRLWELPLPEEERWAHIGMYRARKAQTRNVV